MHLRYSQLAGLIMKLRPHYERSDACSEQYLGSVRELCRLSVVDLHQIWESLLLQKMPFSKKKDEKG